MISIIVPTFNNADTIQRALMSVACQTYHDWQIVIVDDCSTDNTLNIIHDNFEVYYGDKIKILKSKKNMGVGVSRKLGVDAADGEFVIFLDSDDYILPNCLELSMMLQSQQDADVVYTNTTIYVDPQHVKNLDVPDCVMEGKISPTLHINCAKKWLTGKMFRTALMKRVPMSPKRIGEDVNTLFFACYMAKTVRSSSYSGYVHVYRKGSLIGMGDDKPFHYYCLSAECDIEMLEFVLDDNNFDCFGKMVITPYINLVAHKKQIEEGMFNDKELQENKELWDKIQKWFEEHDNLIKKYSEVDNILKKFN